MNGGSWEVGATIARMSQDELREFNAKLDAGLPETDRRYAAAGVPEAVERVGPRGLPLVTLGELRQRLQTENPPAWLVRGLLPADGVSLLVGDPKAGKSTLARCLAHCVVTGSGEFLGRDIGDAGTVVHLALEERRWSVVRHYDQLETPDDGLLVLNESAPVEDRMDRLTESVCDIKPALLIVDTAIRFVDADDGNDYAKMVRALAPFTDLAHEAETHVIARPSRAEIRRTARPRGARERGDSGCSRCPHLPASRPEVRLALRVR
ncbi:AAA family ATPase [Candidatus Palauibacter sp.]|uniref:AAA family ATPase n=1 Tax=Candidatus Palauibacter sp. TaxID=3101350 RepID=UPI003AF224E6